MLTVAVSGGVRRWCRRSFQVNVWHKVPIAYQNQHLKELKELKGLPHIAPTAPAGPPNSSK